jgi:hypothetical protein
MSHCFLQKAWHTHWWLQMSHSFLQDLLSPSRKARHTHWWLQMSHSFLQALLSPSGKAWHTHWWLQMSHSFRQALLSPSRKAWHTHWWLQMSHSFRQALLSPSRKAWHTHWWIQMSHSFLQALLSPSRKHSQSYAFLWQLVMPCKKSRFLRMELNRLARFCTEPFILCGIFPLFIEHWINPCTIIPLTYLSPVVIRSSGQLWWSLKEIIIYHQQWK